MTVETTEIEYEITPAVTISPEEGVAILRAVRACQRELTAQTRPGLDVMIIGERDLEVYFRKAYEHVPWSKANLSAIQVLGALITAGVITRARCLGFPACGPPRPRGRFPTPTELLPKAHRARAWQEDWRLYQDHQQQSHVRVHFVDLETWVAASTLAGIEDGDG